MKYNLVKSPGAEYDMRLASVSLTNNLLPVLLFLLSWCLLNMYPYLSLPCLFHIYHFSSSRRFAFLSLPLLRVRIPASFLCCCATRHHVTIRLCVSLCMDFSLWTNLFTINPISTKSCGHSEADKLLLVWRRTEYEHLPSLFICDCGQIYQMDLCIYIGI